VSIDNVSAIARAILYEGYILYPYRRSSVKNQQRWTFGGLYPRAWCERGNGDAASQQVQCLVEGSGQCAIEVRVRCLHLIDRQVGRVACGADTDEWKPVDTLEVDGQRYDAWQEAAEREIAVPTSRLEALAHQPARMTFALPGSRHVERITNRSGEVAGVLVREQQELRGAVTITAERLGDGLYRLTAITENLTSLEMPAELDREHASLYSMASTHVVLNAAGGAFVSLIDPPARLHDAAAGCKQQGCFPVLVGGEGEHDTLLASPIILYDYPKIAPESPGDLFDGTEIDEILSLRILAMSDAEKAEVAAIDPHARKLLERTESLTSEQWQQLHGAIRGLRPVEPSPLAVGARVRLRPREGGDVMDMALAGKTAIVEGIDRDFEDHVYVAVAVDDDPGRDLGLERMPGHRFFFSPEEVEAL
jgi:hydrogenase maturation protease